MLWSPEPDADAEWTSGSWRIGATGIHRCDSDAPADLTGYAIPGLVDSHCHLGIGPEGPAGPDARRAHAEATVRSGVLAVRDCGSPVDCSDLEDLTVAPRIISAGRHIARPRRYIRDLPIEAEKPADLPRLVAEQAASHPWIKIVGDWIDRSNGADSDLDPLWPREVLIDAVAAAHDAGARVAVHSFGRRTVDDLLSAGVDDIEHATGMDEDQAAEAAARGVLVTPTLLQVELFSDFADQAGAKYPVYARTMREMHALRREHFAMLVDSGVRLLMGTDSGGYQEHGTILREMRLWRERGLPAGDVLDAATWRTRRELGLPALHEGAPADLVVLADDPAERLDALAAPTAIIARGAPLASA
ncbi:amidohydrolase family protein [Actinomyces sp. B33]|uniref:amidohydrolase family protein n=1 Tax=Actinomyces sp. B33 TaxID=2942131 RepID=UPI002341A8F6|nr:amidohydrolase family protein [Actinomyces sp. B33]MDC4232948.1 amidohydrolase family protein [Actinomyces sp. B33]